MKTDTLFYQLFQNFPTLFFELLGLPPESANSYQFVSLEIKEKAFRFDGIFLPPENEPERPILFAEVQFQRDPNFYRSFISEVFMYFNQYDNSQRDWQAVAIFAKRSLDVEIPRAYDALVGSNQIVKIYLDEWSNHETSSWGIGLVQLIVAKNTELRAVVPDFLAQVRSKSEPELQQKIVDWVETVLLYKFPRLSREEIEAMFALSDLKQTRVYKDALEEGEQKGLRQGVRKGRQEGKQEGRRDEAKSLLLRLLSKKLGILSIRYRTKIARLTLEKMEALSEALLDFTNIADLDRWLDEYK